MQQHDPVGQRGVPKAVVAALVVIGLVGALVMLFPVLAFFVLFMFGGELG